MQIKNPLWEASRKCPLIAAHRGVAAGNIPCNSLAAFEAALRQGADILETDLTCAADGTLLVFHPGKEKKHLFMDIHLEQMELPQIRELRFVNIDGDKTQFGILTLDEFLEHFKNRCLLNLDHGWDDMAAMVAAVRRHGMEEQVLLKAPAKLKFAEEMEALAPDMMFMPIYKEQDLMTEQLEAMNLNFAGVELVFAKDDHLFTTEEYIESHHAKGRAVWVNPIVYYHKSQLTGGHNDDVAAAYDPEFGWGWLVDKGYDILQTDWVLPMRLFLDNRTK